MNCFLPANILLPNGADMHRWSVIACDQYTSDLDYWKRVRTLVGDCPSTLHMILPEAELGGNEAEKVSAINSAMERYYHERIFRSEPDAYIYVERTLSNGDIRPGLIGMVDLEAYDYNPGSVSLIRATEKTVLERIPPRQRVRKDASLEFPHVLMLCDDHEKILIETVANEKESFELLYDFDLMENGGHITGWLVSQDAKTAFNERLTAYSRTFEAKYEGLDGAKVLFAVGDGNHSLATAKSCYETLKREHPEIDHSNHPARFALVELENIHDPSLSFEPIHRIIFDTDPERLLEALKDYCAQDGYVVEYITAKGKGTLCLDPRRGALAIAVLQEALDTYLADHKGEIDYIHGDEVLTDLAQKENAIGFLLPPMEKSQLFRGVISGGVLPRKTFSMGHAQEKRYYLEGRRIK